MDEETAKAASKLEDDMKRLRAQFGAFGRELGRDIIPWLADLVAKLVDASKAAGGLWSGLSLFIRSPGDQAAREAKHTALQAQLDETERRIAALPQSKDGPVTVSPVYMSTLYRRRNELLEQIGELGALEAEAAKREQRENSPPGTGTPPSVTNPPTTRRSSRKDDSFAAILAKAKRDAEDAGYKYRLALAKEEQDVLDELAKREKKRVDDLTKSSEKVWKDYYENTTERANEYARMLAEVNRKQTDSFADLKDAVEGWGRSFSRTMGEAVVTGNLTARSIGDAFQNLAIEIASKQIQKRVTDPLVSLGTSFLDAIFGGSSSLVPVAERPIVLMADPPVGLQAVDWEFAGGGVMTSRGAMPLRRYSRGGIANRPQLAMFGEGDNPEAYVPLPDGRRIPVAMQGGAQSIVVRIENTGSPKEVTQAQPTVTPEGIVVQVFTSDLMTGGPISQAMERAYSVGRSVG